MEDDPDTLCARLDRLAALVELAQQAAPEDRARLERTIQLASLAREAVAQARQAAQRASRLTKEAEANQVHGRIELAALLAELRIMRDNTSK